MTRLTTRMMSRRGLVLGTIGAVGSSAALALPARCQGRIYPGASILGTDLSGQTRADSRAILERTFSSFTTAAVTFTFGDRSWTASLAELGGSIDYDTMLDEAMARGREEGVVDRYRSILGIAAHHEIPLVLTVQPDVLRSYLATIDREIRIEPTNARVVARADGGITIMPDRDGRELDLDAAGSLVMAAVTRGQHATITLPSRVIQAAVPATALAAAKESAIELISTPVYFTHEGSTYPIDTDDLAGALVIERNGASWLDAARIPDRIDAIGWALARSPRNVMLGWDSGPYVVEPDEDGLQLDREALAGILTDTARSASRTAALPVQAVPAAARVDNLDQLGLETHLASGSSDFTGSSSARATNVVVSSTNISYKLVAPGEEFSFNHLLGPITPEMGFVSGTIIQGDWAATDIGGGVCQVSTTVFRAAARAGFRFEEWNPHSWRLAFYEIDGSPPGFDAAIYQPNDEGEWEKDLRFRNPLDSWLLLMLVVDGDTVRAHFYGRDPGWAVEFGEARVSDPKTVPEPVMRHNPDLAPGEQRLVQQAKPGYTVRIRRTVTDLDGNVLADGDFVSDYRSQPEAWEVG